MNLSFVSLSVSDIFVIDVTTLISPALCINFAKIYANSKVVILITSLFCRIFSLVKIFY